MRRVPGTVVVGRTLLEEVVDFLANHEGMIDNNFKHDPPYPNRAMELKQRITDILGGRE